MCKQEQGKSDLEIVLNGMSNENAIFHEVGHHALNLFKRLRWK
jgi:hypothetical protein